jgi:glucosamine 6-phosphate synthetase-like amidotransferase/phosphosugar isomerase protein
MEKEIFEQPAALENSMRGRFSEDGSTANFGGLNITPASSARSTASCSAPAAPPGTPAW